MPKDRRNKLGRKEQKQISLVKVKLRTAAEVINRLKWSYDDPKINAQNTLIGYQCRINGPMEKCVADFISIDEGGDIPEHRIQYFRQDGLNQMSINDSILWDRNGRVDKLFGSGAGKYAPISPITQVDVERAIQTMNRLAEEKAIRINERAKYRARQQKAKKKNLIFLNSKLSSFTSENVQNYQNKRHTWKVSRQFSCFDFKEKKWISTEVLDNMNSSYEDVTDLSHKDSLKLITWNILFDLHKKDSNEFIQGDDSLLNDIDTTPNRWDKLRNILAKEDADIIALQEVTPRFLQQLKEQTWLQKHYSLSSCNDDGSLDPYGNLIIWKNRTFPSCESVHFCQDGERNRAVIVSLAMTQQDNAGKKYCDYYNFACVHLPADQWDKIKQKTRDRSIARSKELSSIIAKLQVLEQHIKMKKKITSKRLVTPLILGDFNTDDSNLFGNSSIFVDAWVAVAANNNILSDEKQGYTYDWKTNRRANKTRLYGHAEREPRRIDRIFIGNHTHDDKEIVNTINLKPFESKLLGKLPDKFSREENAYPPSDHYGVSLSLSLPKSSHLSHHSNLLYNPSQVGQNVWAALTPPTTQSILALVFEEEYLLNLKNGERRKLYDEDSTLPLTHITLLNGFVDISSHESKQLAIQAVEDAVRQTFYTKDQKQSWSLTLDDIKDGRKALDIFEHRDSATLICHPTCATTIDSNKSNQQSSNWLVQLYETLRLNFHKCNEQESRFLNGWTPHFSLGSFPTTAAAREALKYLIDSSISYRRNNEIVHGNEKLNVHGIGLFQRNVDDQKFYPVATVPLCYRKLQIDARNCDVCNFLDDAGLSCSRSMNGNALLVLRELERACEYLVNKKFEGKRGSIKSCVYSYGSRVLGALLPGISDLDIVVQLKATTLENNTYVQSINKLQFLEELSKRLTILHENSKIRIRVSKNSSGSVLHILTIKIAPQYPSTDLLLSLTDAQGRPIDTASQIALDSIKDSEAILASVDNDSSTDSLRKSIKIQIFQGALRIIKLWAYRQKIYGSSTGYLGGGGWATLLAWVIQRSSFMTDNDDDDDTKLTSASRQLVSYFFRNVLSFWSDTTVITLVKSGSNNIIENTLLMDQAINRVSSRNSIAILTSESGGDFGRSTTCSTTKVIKMELQRANNILLAKSGNLEYCLRMQSPLTQPHLLVIQTEIPKYDTGSTSRPIEVKAYCATQGLNLIIELERVIDSDDIRPSSVIIRRDKSFLFLIGVEDNDKSSSNKTNASKKEILSKFVVNHNKILEEASKSISHPRCTIILTELDIFKGNLDYAI